MRKDTINSNSIKIKKIGFHLYEKCYKLELFLQNKLKKTINFTL